MVMEAATLSSPQRKFNVVPVQKSLSLPSYARAGGEGIDHRLIFAALEQKEKVRRKSKIFTKEKSSRQNIFCLPIPSSAKCRETSLSSDTSCSSLEYQKPKPLAKAQKEDSKTIPEKTPSKTDQPLNESAITKTTQSELKPNSDPLRRDVLSRNAAIRDSELNPLLKKGEECKGHHSPVDTMKLNVGSSDSMDRSSRSSNDSISRKERLVAIKARVEAAREKYGESSSEEESRSSITKYNSDGVIHRTVRDVKYKSTRSERKLRRRSQDEWAIKKATRKSNLSLCLTPENGSIRPVAGGLSPSTEDNINNLEIKTDFCPSPNVTDMLKKNYFSDYPSRENAARFVQARIRHIEDEERKRRSGSDFREKSEIPTRQSPQHIESFSPVTTENRRRMGEINGYHINTSEKTSYGEFATRASPIPRSSQAPTPPPRSPKSITFVNKAFIQHQNASLLHNENSLERKKLLKQNIPSTFSSKLFDQFNSKSEAVIADSKYSTDTVNEASEKQKIRELICSRRKTCGNFDFIDQNTFTDFNPLKNSTCFNSASSTNSFSSLSQVKRIENKGYFSSSEMHCAPLEDPASKLWKSKWQENEQRREYMFNSLESKRKCNPPSWIKWKNPTLVNDTCESQLFSNTKLSSAPKDETSSILLKGVNQFNSKDISSLSIQYPLDRLSKSEINIAFNEKMKTPRSEVKENHPYNFTFKTFLETPRSNNTKSKVSDKASATANLESAMEELESVYQSLKISSDNLSDKNNASNSLDDKDGKRSKYSYNSVNEDNVFKRRSSVCEISSTFIKSDFHDLIKMRDRKKPGVFTRSSDSVPVSKEKSSDQFSIDELFNDLTQQLDLEQKLLKEPRDNKPQPKSCCQGNKLFNSRPLNPQPSQISIRKEFFDNLSKNNLNQSKKYSTANENNADNSQPAFTKKKYKAVRSLSENISYLMATSNPNPASQKPASITNNGLTEDTSKSTAIEQYYERVRDPTNTDLKSDLSRKTSITLSNADNSFKTHNSNQDEIRHIRVSMDTNNFQLKPVTKDATAKHYARLSSAVCSQVSSKHETAPRPNFKEIPPTNDSKDTTNMLDKMGVDQLIHSLLGEESVDPPPMIIKDSSPMRHSTQEAFPTNCNSKESSDVLEEGLEKLLNRLLGDVPDRQQSSLLQSKDLGPPTPPPVATGKLENVKINRNILPSNMDIYVSPNEKNNISNTECCPKIDKSEENAQKINGFRQNNNGVANQMSFIPVYTKKTNMCHNLPKSNTGDEKNKGAAVELQDPSKPVNKLHSPPVRRNCLLDQNEKLSGRTVNMHTRRRSVGFEDMTSMPNSYGYNLSNEKRYQVEQLNSNIATGSVISKNRLNPGRDLSFPFKKEKEHEIEGIQIQNQNTQITGNENSFIQRITKPSEQFKDKSSKRKSSLNRIDFVDLPSLHSEKLQQQKASCYHLNSSSDEGSDSKSKPNSEFLSSSIKRKHNTNQAFSKAADKKNTEAALRNASPLGKARSNVLPKTLQSNHSKVRLHKKMHSSAVHLQKFSHSAGELESLTDLSEAANVSNKICLSAQEFDVHDASVSKSKNTPSKLCLQLHQPVKPSHTTALLKNSNENPSHNSTISKLTFIGCVGNFPENAFSQTVTSKAVSCPNSKSAEKLVLETAEGDEKKLTFKGFDLNGSLDLKHIDSRSEDESELLQTTSIIENLDISSERDFDNELYISAEENSDQLVSDSERRPSSILRKKLFEEKRELHGILKPPPHEKQSKTPPSILKHRESSEEKDIWQSGDLHSILKKSTSEEESCNSGPDIRPILKVSTDEESPSGSARPRPILKKRTSFSEECSYVSYPNGELKPILKKKTPLSMDEQPRPILKSRRKSEDARSSLPEFIASRPRAYSADMGVKSSHENRFDDFDLQKESFSKQEYHDL